ncbi:unnamed protein product, partial [Iphiclides podalirius]
MDRLEGYQARIRPANIDVHCAALRQRYFRGLTLRLTHYGVSAQLPNTAQGQKAAMRSRIDILTTKKWRISLDVKQLRLLLKYTTFIWICALQLFLRDGHCLPCRDDGYWLSRPSTKLVTRVHPTESGHPNFRDVTMDVIKDGTQDTANDSISPSLNTQMNVKNSDSEEIDLTLDVMPNDSRSNGYSGNPVSGSTGNVPALNDEGISGTVAKYFGVVLEIPKVTSLMNIQEDDEVTMDVGKDGIQDTANNSITPALGSQMNVQNSDSEEIDLTPDVMLNDSKPKDYSGNPVSVSTGNVPGLNDEETSGTLTKYLREDVLEIPKVTSLMNIHEKDDDEISDPEEKYLDVTEVPIVNSLMNIQETGDDEIDLTPDVVANGNSPTDFPGYPESISTNNCPELNSVEDPSIPWKREQVYRWGDWIITSDNRLYRAVNT